MIAKPTEHGTDWVPTEVRYGAPRTKPFALNCTFGLPRVTLRPEPSLTPQPKATGSPSPKTWAYPALSTKATPVLATSPIMGSTKSRADAVRDLDAARAMNEMSFEAFTQPRDAWPGTEEARRNVPAVAGIARAKRRQVTGDSSSDSDNELDHGDLQDRLQKLLQRRKNLRLRARAGASNNGPNNNALSRSLMAASGSAGASGTAASSLRAPLDNNRAAPGQLLADPGSAPRQPPRQRSPAAKVDTSV